MMDLLDWIVYTVAILIIVPSVLWTGFCLILAGILRGAIRDTKLQEEDFTETLWRNDGS